MEEAVKYTKSNVLAVNRAITRVRDKQNMMGQTIPGCSFPSSVMFLNAWNQNHAKGEVDGIIEAMKPVRKKNQDDKGQWIKKVQDEKGKWSKGGMEKFAEAEATYLKKEAEGIEFRPYSLKELSKCDTDEYLKKANAETPVPQEFYSLLMDAGLLIDDLDKKEPKKEKK